MLVKKAILIFWVPWAIAHAQTTYKVDVYPTENCTFKWYCETIVQGGGPLQAMASISGTVGLVGFADAKTVTGTVIITARVETDTPDKKEHLFGCRPEPAFYNYSQEGRIGASVSATLGHQPTPPNVIPCDCDASNCEACFEDDPFPGGDLCDYFPDFCKRGGEPDPADLLELCPPECTSPLVVDLGGDGFSFGGPESAVAFDLLRAGVPLRLQWVTPDGNDAFLVQDLNDNGIGDDGAELFGNGTRLYFHSLGLAPNGFVALAQYDDPELGGNDDGFISPADLVWRRLSLWLDADANGICDPAEMMALPHTLITRLETIPSEHRHYDAHGNHLRYRAQLLVGTAPFIRPFDMVDVFFKQVD